jgi:hypothetical protein
MGNSNSSRSYMDVKTEVVTNIKDQMSYNFSSQFSSTTKTKCQGDVSQKIVINDGINVRGNGNTTTLGNKAVMNVECALNDTSENDLQSFLVNSLQAAVNTEVTNDVKNAVEQNAKNGWLSLGANSNNSKTVTNIENSQKTYFDRMVRYQAENVMTKSVISEAKASTLQNIKVNGGVNIDGSNNQTTIANDVSSIVRSESVTNAINSFVSKVENELKLEQTLKANNMVKNDTKQTGTNVGVEGVICAGITALLSPMMMVSFAVFILCACLMMMGGGRGGSGGGGGGGGRSGR